MPLNYKSPSQQRGGPAGYTTRGTFCIPLNNVQPTSANYVTCAIFSGLLANVRIRRIYLWNPGSFTAAQKTNFDMIRLTGYTSGGVAFTPPAYDPNTARQAAFSGWIYTGNPTVTTTGNSMILMSGYSPTAVATYVPFCLDWSGEMGVQAPLIPQSNAQYANGLAIRCTNGAAGGNNVDLMVEFTEEEY